MLEWARAIHEAIGIESPKIFVAVFALDGLLLFGLAGWVIDRGYRVRIREQSAHAAGPKDKPPLDQPKEQSKTPSNRKVRSQSSKRPSPQIIQNAPGGINSVITGGNPTVTNTVVNAAPAPPTPDKAQQKTMADILRAEPNKLIAVFIGRGRESQETISAAFAGTDWEVWPMIYPGFSLSSDVPMPDVSYGVHILENGSSAATLERALSAVGIIFERAPWDAAPATARGSGARLMLIIGNPK